VFTMDSRDTVMQQLPFQFYPEVNQVRWPLFKRAMEEALVGLCQKLDICICICVVVYRVMFSCSVNHLRSGRMSAAQPYG
jgi:hypothetical protein